LEHAEVSGLIASEEYTPVLDKAAVRLEIKQRYVMDTVTKPENNDLHEDWRPLGSVREDQPASFVEATITDDDLAQVLYTSGTESRPKGVMLSQNSLISQYVSISVDGKIEENS